MLAFTSQLLQYLRRSDSVFTAQFLPSHSLCAGLSTVCPQESCGYKQRSRVKGLFFGFNPDVLSSSGSRGIKSRGRYSTKYPFSTSDPCTQPFVSSTIATTFTHDAGHVNGLIISEESSRRNISDATVIFVLGGPGSGKGTQCSKLVGEFGFTHLSAGDLLRNEVHSDSQDGAVIAETMKSGEIVPKEITINLLRSAMRASASSNFLIDGFPRALDQGVAFEQQVCRCAAVLFLDCPEHELEARLLKRAKRSGRIDDNMDTIRKRFHTYTTATLPVIDHFDRRGILYRIPCTRSADEVYTVVRALMIPYLVST